jgi:hypothetical protein
MRSLLLAALVMTWASVASAEDPAACARSCAATLKQFDAQCKKAAKDAQTEKGCAIVRKQFEQECAKDCANDGKPQKPGSTNSF